MSEGPSPGLAPLPSVDTAAWIRALLDGEWREGVRGAIRVDPYKKWGGAHWRLVSLAELEVTVNEPDPASVLEAWGQVVGWLLGAGHLANVPCINGRYRRCASQEGNALWAAARIGLGDDGTRDRLAANLMAWQWPDGGWNCDRRPSASHSSFNESWAPLRGLVGYRRVTTNPGVDVTAAIERAAEFLLRHRVVESERTGELANPRLIELAWPPYWHYGLLPGLRALHEAGRLDDPRAVGALDRLEARRGADGLWHADRRYWRAGKGTGTELVAWGKVGEARMLSLQAREVLAAAGR